MKTYKAFIAEAANVRVFHGTKYNTTSINPAHMNNSINEYGVGIYFTDNVSTTKMYGSNVIEAMVDPSRFIDASSPVSRVGPDYLKLLLELKRTSLEGIYYMVTDFGVEIGEPEEVTDAHIRYVYDKIKRQQIRHSQQEITDNVGVENFVKAWNNNIRLDGLTDKKSTGETFYVIINPKIKVSKFKG